MSFMQQGHGPNIINYVNIKRGEGVLFLKLDLSISGLRGNLCEFLQFVIQIPFIALQISQFEYLDKCENIFR